MKKFNKLSKIISMTLTACMLLSICSVSVVFADGDRIFADPTYDYYAPVDKSSGAMNTYSIYMESKYANLKYHNTSFLGNKNYPVNPTAIAWPPALRERTGNNYPEQKAEEPKKVGSDYILRSKNVKEGVRSRVKYRMPARITPTESQVNSGNKFDLNEALIIDYNRVSNGGTGEGISGVVEIGKSYEKIHLLVGIALEDENATAPIFQAHVVYEDGTATLPEGVRTIWLPIEKNEYKFPDTLIDAEDSDGRKGYISQTLPFATANGQKNADNFVADFESYVTPTTMYSRQNLTYSAQFSKSEGVSTVAAYEYTLTLDPQKVISKIIFSQTRGLGGYVVLGISGENEREDWTQKVADINAAIDELSTASSASDIAETMELINSATEAGVESYVDVAKFNGLFADDEFTGNLVDAMLAGVDPENVTWGDTTNKFKDLDDVASVIEETGNLGTCSARDNILKAYEGMVDSLINEEEKDNDEMLERFELLKSAKTTAFRNKFEEKVIYNTSEPTISTTPERVIFEVNFSAPVEEEKFIKGNFEILRGSEEINSSWITVKPKLSLGFITGAEVEVLNSQDYTKPYTFTVSRDLKGENNKAWAYLLTTQSNASAPFTVSPNEIQLNTSDRTFKGKITLGNSSGSQAPCIILITSYDKDGKCLGTISAHPRNGTAATGSTDIEFEGTLPDGAKEVLCYVYDSVTSMTLLTPPMTITIPSN